jgi:hypothetical protein
MLHRQIRTGQRWRRRFKTGESLNWYEDFARRWNDMERDVMPVLQKFAQQLADRFAGIL